MRHDRFTEQVQEVLRDSVCHCQRSEAILGTAIRL
jgi:hypothetical protein